MDIHIPKNLKKTKDITITKQELIDFESKVAEYYNDSKIKSAIHLSKGNENELIEIFQYVHPDDWVLSAWRNHYHALLHGMSPDTLFQDILDGRSMSTSGYKFYASSIVGGIVPIAVGIALALKFKKSERMVWCFIGDMTFRTGIFYEAYTYAKNFKLPVKFVVEDNGVSVDTPTSLAWGGKIRIPRDIIYYKYKLQCHHHGTGKYITF